MYLTEYDEAEHMRLFDIEKQCELEEIRKAHQREFKECRTANQQEIEDVRTETQDAETNAIPIALYFIRESATTVKDLTDHGIPERIMASFYVKDLPNEGKCDKDER